MRRQCAMQERCHQEVRDKLYDWGLWKTEVEEIISQLITEDFLNEERFAIAYVGGKFRIKRWGKQKILMNLKQKQVSEYNIRRGMKEIEDADYEEAVRQLINKKAELVREPDAFKKRTKIGNYLINKGYESELVWKMMKEVYPS